LGDFKEAREIVPLDERYNTHNTMKKAIGAKL
jgi:hypothetical protein